jgi:lysine-specific demethylase 8
LKAPEPVEQLAELDASDPLVQNISADRTIGSVKRISPEDFHQKYRLTSTPVIIKGIASAWPAATKWKDPRYFSEHFGKSSVPIEVGGHYLASNWTQKMVSFKDFIEKYITLENKSNLDESTGLPKKIGYLAQHKLFAQFPALMEDFQQPPHCSVNGDELSSIHGWIGPKATVSPLHKDPYHNLLAQVVGYKYVRLFHPSSSASLYPYSDPLFRNTSQLSIQHPDYDKFPLAKDLDYRECLLKPGEILYIPQGYWHFVKSASYSCSVSFWFIGKSGNGDSGEVESTPL